jgi:hypothetical protein
MSVSTFCAVCDERRRTWRYDFQSFDKHFLVMALLAAGAIGGAGGAFNTLHTPARAICHRPSWRQPVALW